MIVSHEGLKIELLADPHLGKPFINGVPLHRRGVREKMLWADFERSLSQTAADCHINLGDLFDRAFVPYDVILRAAAIYRQAAEDQPQTQFLILQGNHDVSRDLERASAFDVFAEVVWGTPNITVVREIMQLCDLLLVPFDPVMPATELLREFEPTGAAIAFGHYDVDPRSDDHNLIPTKLLSEMGITKAFTGHVHKPDRFTRDGVDVTVVGSMQPYAHGEGDMYVTLTLDEARAATDLKDKCVRVMLQPGEVYDLELDCLQLTVKRVSDEPEEETVTLGDFDMAALFAKAFDQADVDADLRATILGKYDELRAVSG